MKIQAALLVATLLSAINAHALVIYMPNPQYLYTITTEQVVPAAPGQFCKLTIYQDIYSGAPPIIRQGMVCVGQMY